MFWKNIQVKERQCPEYFLFPRPINFNSKFRLFSVLQSSTHPSILKLSHPGWGPFCLSQGCELWVCGQLINNPLAHIPTIPTTTTDTLLSTIFIIIMSIQLSLFFKVRGLDIGGNFIKPQMTSHHLGFFVLQ